MSARLSAKGVRQLAAEFTELLDHQPCPDVPLWPTQLSQPLPGLLHVLARLSHGLAVTENPQLFTSEWDLFIQDLPSG